MRIAILSAFLLAFPGIAQLNTTLVGQLDLSSLHSTRCNDIWGYVDTAGNEYAIVGTEVGTSIVDISDPTNPQEVYFKPGMQSVWRDIKTWNKHAYVTTEASESLLILDLSSLPDASGIDTTHWEGIGLPTERLKSAHNLFIDSSGYAYIFGSNKDNGGVRILDLNADPMNPTEVGSFEDWYVHDGVVKNDTMFLGNIYQGFFSIIDVSNKSNPQVMATANTPGNFTHNLWFADDLDHVYTTDEIGNGFVAAYDITDFANITEMDRVQSNPGTHSIPHNAHFINDYIVTSYYRDGVVIHDVSNPSNIIEVANYDSHSGSGNGFDGCWGAYPWLPSGHVIISDRQSGLYILDVNYQKACYLTGQVTDVVSSGPIPNANVQIISDNQISNTGLTGNYETGIATAGTYSVIYSKPTYFPDTVTGVVLSNGNTTIQDAQLNPKQPFDMVIRVVDGTSGSGIENANVEFFSPDFEYAGLTDANGYITFNPVYEDSFDLAAGKWGYWTDCIQRTYFDPLNDSIELVLEPGYMDDFAVDLGWQTFSIAASGDWVREEPVGAQSNGTISAPFSDQPWDCYGKAYVTGNGGTTPDDDDIDDGQVDLVSPTMDFLTGIPMTDPYIYFDYWWFTQWGPLAIDDTLRVTMVTPSSVIELDKFGASESASYWKHGVYRVSDYVPITDGVYLIFSTSDLDSNVNITEAGLDVFYVLDGQAVTVEEEETSGLKLYPNPTSDQLFLDGGVHNARFEIFNLNGQLVLRGTLQGESITVESLHKGNYFIRVVDRTRVDVLKFVKL